MNSPAQPRPDCLDAYYWNTRVSTSRPAAAAVASLALILLAIVDFRRGFLFPAGAYLAKTPFYVFSAAQPVMVLAGVLGLFFSLRHLRRPDSRLASRLFTWVFLLLLVDVFLYRGVAASRSIAAGKIGTDWLLAFGFEGWLKPFALSVSYLITVWHATFLSCLAAGFGILALPRFLKTASARPGVWGTFAGAMYALTQPFCSCCVALTSPGLFGRGRSMSFGLAVILGAPLMNLSTLVLAGNLLPWPFAALRIVGGVAVTLALSLVLSCWAPPAGAEAFPVPPEAGDESPAGLLTAWLRLSGRVALVLVPATVVGTILSSALWGLWPQGMGNSAASVLLAALVGSLVMATTWTEIPLAAQMIQQGLSGPAAALLLALPAVNLGSLLIVARVSRSWKAAVGLGVGIFAVSVLAGLAFL